MNITLDQLRTALYQAARTERHVARFFMPGSDDLENFNLEVIDPDKLLAALAELDVEPPTAPSTVFELVAGHLEHERLKHDLSASHTINAVNSWTNYELLEKISAAVEQIRSAP